MIQHEIEQAVLADSVTFLSATLNSTSSVHIMDANETREYMCFSLYGGAGTPDAWIKLMTSSLNPNNRDGILIKNGQNFIMQHPVM